MGKGAAFGEATGEPAWQSRCDRLAEVVWEVKGWAVHAGGVDSTVERAVDRLKQFRAVAIGYAKRGYVPLGTVTAAALVIWLRV